MSMVCLTELSLVEAPFRYTGYFLERNLKFSTSYSHWKVRTLKLSEVIKETLLEGL